jgi:hypothetical protein
LDSHRTICTCFFFSLFTLVLDPKHTNFTRSVPVYPPLYKFAVLWTVQQRGRKRSSGTI